MSLTQLLTDSIAHEALKRSTPSIKQSTRDKIRRLRRESDHLLGSKHSCGYQRRRDALARLLRETRGGRG